ncbi:nicotinate-nucleotide pyrophosphorylase [carboxylating]-like [Uloborus diversus]|uniref:nicotinate-nucleotide pyrophosphorylase [carboxylating]-like n=1 Tax=Uloborus diversus TaxID=327109 RepID=UPI00240A2A75|nr:nicotinate-nucleotide pyrophosphorylase [carboxylating]-like [Uloborus diversus]
MLESILHPIHLKELAKQWMLEDVTNYDFGGGVVGDTECEFTIFMKSPGVLAGIPFANAVFSELGLKANWIHKEGEKIFPITPVVKIFGSARKLLLAERIVLNVLSRASGVATIASNMKSQLESVGWKGALAGTRKTTPGFRMVEKYALLVGGADTHRYDLSSMVMLKDNHVTISGSIETFLAPLELDPGLKQRTSNLATGGDEGAGLRPTETALGRGQGYSFMHKNATGAGRRLTEIVTEGESSGPVIPKKVETKRHQPEV